MGLEGDCADQREAKTSQCDVFKESAYLHLVTRTPQQTSSIFLQPTAIHLQLHPKNRSEYISQILVKICVKKSPEAHNLGDYFWFFNLYLFSF